jgi:hypothetical protein
VTNPYQTVANISTGQTLRHSIAPWYWLAWSAGTVAIVLSWLTLAPPVVGWTGFGLALIASVATQFAGDDRLLSRAPQDLAVLTDDMIRRQDHGFRMALRLCRAGGTVLYRGVAVTFGRSSLVCSTITALPPGELDDYLACQQAQSATATVQKLVDELPDIPVDIAQQSVVTIVISEFGRNGVEICRVIDGRVQWAA